MNNYESVIITNIKEKISEYAKITKEVDIGVKTLAYEIKKNKTGHYLLYEFEVAKEKKDETIKEIERFYRITEEIIKYIIIKLEEKGLK